jgi:hypothetical protein
VEGNLVAGELTGLSAIQCRAVGFCVTVGGAAIETLTGTTWTAVDASPPAYSYGAVMHSLACLASGCIGVGDYGATNGKYEFFAQSIPGESVELLAPAGTSNSDDFNLGSMACASSGHCVAVGAVDGSSSSFGILMTIDVIE